jgi:antitoxin MazE
MYILLYILMHKEGDEFMQTTIQKWGNSQGIRIPKAFLEALEMMENDLVELSRVDDNIVIRKVKEKKELTLEDIFKDYDGESAAEEFDWGASVGKEVW